MDKQKVFWISQKTTARAGKKIIAYGDEVTNLFTDEQIAYHKEQSEVGTVEMATPEGVKVDAALQKANARINDYKIVALEVTDLMLKSTISRNEKDAMLETIKALS